MQSLDKEKIFDIIVKNRYSIFNRKNKEELFKNFLVKNNIDLDLDIKHSIAFLKNINIKCKREGCQNERMFKGLWLSNRYEFGFLKYCSPECENAFHSEKQMGKNNSCHKMTPESHKSMRSKLSKIMKEKIKNGKFVPPITNAWAGSKVRLTINNEIKFYRSSWEAFFHLCNEELLYEKISIEYVYKGDIKNYVVDFVDINNKILYEIKPNRTKDNDRNKSKQFYAEKWCLENGFKYLVISDEWFSTNYMSNIYKLDGQIDADIIKKRLKQFYENKEN